MNKQFDLVKIIKPKESIYNNFIGAIGLITKVDSKHLGYPYHITFIDNEFRKQSDDVGGLLWSDEEIEGV